MTPFGKKRLHTKHDIPQHSLNKHRHKQHALNHSFLSLLLLFPVSCDLDSIRNHSTSHSFSASYCTSLIGVTCSDTICPAPSFRIGNDRYRYTAMARLNTAR